MSGSAYGAHGEHHGAATLYRTPGDAMAAAPEKLAYVALLDPDAIAVVDVDPESTSCGSVVGQWDASRQDPPDEFHHYGWNICSSALGGDHDHDGAMDRRFLVVPGIRSSRIYVLDTGVDPRNPTLIRTIEPEEVMAEGHYSRPHTVHCGPRGAARQCPRIRVGRRQRRAGRHLHDGPLRLQRHGSVGARPGQPVPCLRLLVAHRRGRAGRQRMGPAAIDRERDRARGPARPGYGHKLHFFDLEERRQIAEVDLGDQHQMALEVRPAHDPTKTYGFLGVVIDVTDLSASVWTWHKDGDEWKAVKTIEIPAVPLDADRLPALLQGFGAVPPLVTDIDLSLDDRFLYVACWGTGELRQYDVSDPFAPQLTGTIELGGIGRHSDHPSGRAWGGGPQMVEVSRDGRRVYGTNSLYGAWDPQFYPDGVPGAMFKADVDVEGGGLTLAADFHVEFPGHRSHQIRLEGGDCSTDSFCFV